MADAIFMDILPRYDWAASEAGVRKLVGTFDSAAKQVSRTFGVEAGNAAKGAVDKINADMARMQQAVNVTTTKATEDYRRLILAQGDLEKSTLRLVEVNEKYGAESSQWAAAVSRQEAATIALTNAQRANASSAAEMGAANEAAAAKQLEHEAAMRRSSGAVAALGAAANTAGIVAAGATAVIAGATTKMAGDFQASQEKLVTTAGESEQALGQVSQGILDMAGKVGYSAQEISKGMYTVESAGYHGAEGLKVMQAAAQGAREEQADLTQVTNAVTTALHDYHLPADQAAVVTSKMIAAVSQGKTTFGEFAESLHSVQPLAAAAGININDLYASLAQMTASGMSADQATQNMADAIRHLQNPTSQMSNELAQLGLDSRDLQAHLGERGLAGSMELISRTILEKMGPSGKVMLDAFNQSKMAGDDATKVFANLPESARKVAQGVMDNTVSLGDYRKALKGLPEQQANLLNQWRNLHDRAAGFSNILKSGGNDVQSYTAALAKATGDASSLQVALMLTGENSEKTSQDIQLITDATANADGSVKGWEKTQATFNTRLAEAKAGFGALGIEIGNTFLPFMTELAKHLGEVAHWLGEHKGVADALVVTLGTLGTAWVAVKVAMGIKTVVDGFTAGITTMMSWSKRGYTAIMGDAATAASAQTKITTEAAAANTALGTSRATASNLGRDAVIAADEAEGVAEEGLATKAGTTDAAMMSRKGAPAAAGVAGPLTAGLVLGSMTAQGTESIPAVHDRFHNPDGSLKDPVSRWLHDSPLNILGFQSGGVLPGYSPGVDNLLGMVNGKPVGLSGGEGILVPEAARAMGPGAIDSINAFFSGGRAGASSGGVMGALGDAFKGILTSQFGGIPSQMLKQGATTTATGSPLAMMAMLGGPATAGGTPSSNKQLAMQMFGKYFSPSEWAAFDKLENSEASYNNRAKNPSSTAYGMGQFLDSTWAGFGPKTDDPATQLAYMFAYIKQRYGTPSAAWAFHQAHNWYSKGGIVGFDTGTPSVPVDPSLLFLQSQAAAQQQLAAQQQAKRDQDAARIAGDLQAALSSPATAPLPAPPKPPPGPPPRQPLSGLSPLLSGQGYTPGTGDPNQYLYGAMAPSVQSIQTALSLGTGPVPGAPPPPGATPAAPSTGWFGNWRPSTATSPASTTSASAPGASSSAGIPVTPGTSLADLIPASSVYSPTGATSSMMFSGASANVMGVASAASKLPYNWGGFSLQTGFDCSGLAAALANAATGQDPIAGGRFSTANEGAELARRGFKPGAGGLGSLTIGWDSTHTGVTLPDGSHIDAENEKNGIVLGPGSKGATGFPNVMHFDMPGGAPIAGLNMPGASSAASMPGTAGTPGAKGNQQQYDPFSQFTGEFSIKNIVGMMTTFLLELATGNPYGQLRAGGPAGPGGPASPGGLPPSLSSILSSSATGATPGGAPADIAAVGYPPASPQYAPTVDASSSALSNYNNVNAKTLQYQADLAKASQRIDTDKQKLTEAVGKHGADSPQAVQAQHNLDVANQAMGNLQTRIQQAGSNAADQASIDAARVASQATPSAASQRSLQGQQATVDAANAVGLGPGGAAPGMQPAAGMAIAPPVGAPQIAGAAYDAGGPGAQLTPDMTAPSSVQPTQQPGAGQNLGSGFSTSIGSQALGALPIPGMGQAGKLLDRTIGYAGQVAGIMAMAPIETFLPSGVGDLLGNPSKSWFGKLALGIGGSHSDAPNRAGQSAPAVGDKGGGGASQQAASSAGAVKMPDQPHGPPGGDPSKGQGQGAPLIGQQTINTTNGVDGDALGRDMARYSGALGR